VDACFGDTPDVLLDVLTWRVSTGEVGKIGRTGTAPVEIY